MQIQRNYSQSFFAPRRRRSWTRYVFMFSLLVGVALGVIALNLERIEATAMDMMGLGPTPTPFPSELAMQASVLMIEGDLAGAAALFEQVIAQRPSDVDYLYEYGRLQLELGDTQRALDLALACQQADPRDPRGFALQAEALVLAGDAASAIPVALTGLTLADNYAPLYAALSRAYTDSGRLADGIDAGLRAVEANPLDSDARRAYAYALNLSGLRDDATAQLEEAVRIDPGRIPAHFELAYQYLAANRDQEAIDLYNLILSQQPNNARAMLRLCTAYRKVGQFQRALDYCEDAAAAAPDSAPAHYEVGRLRYNAYDFAGALQAFDACLANDSANLECNYYRGLSYFYLNDCDAAWQILRESLAVARSRSGTQDAVADIREGLIAIEQTCPQYSGQAGGLLGPQGLATPEGS